MLIKCTDCKFNHSFWISPSPFFISPSKFKFYIVSILILPRRTERSMSWQLTSTIKSVRNGIRKVRCTDRCILDVDIYKATGFHRLSLLRKLRHNRWFVQKIMIIITTIIIMMMMMVVVVMVMMMVIIIIIINFFLFR